MRAFLNPESVRPESRQELAMRITLSRYSLRTLLVAVTVLAVAIAWWIRPRSVEIVDRDDGTLAALGHRLRPRLARAINRLARAVVVPRGWAVLPPPIGRGPGLGEDSYFVGPGFYGDPEYPPQCTPNPPTADYVSWLVHDRIPISTDLAARGEGGMFSYP